MAGISIPQFKRELKTKHAAGMDIERTGIESIDSFDAKSYECRNEFLGIRFDVESNSLPRSTVESNEGVSIRQSNRTGGGVRSEIDRFDRTEYAMCRSACHNVAGSLISCDWLTRHDAPDVTR